MAFTTSTLAVLTAGAAISKFVSSGKSATGATRQADYEAALLEENAKVAEMQASDSIVRGKEAEYRQQADTRGLIGSQRASLAAQGIAIDSGSALDIQMESAGLGEIDRMTIRNNAAREAWGFKVQASDYRNRAKLTRYAGKNTASGIRMASYGTLLTDAAAVGDLYRKR